MAIYSAVPPPDQQAAPATPHHAIASVDIEAWTYSALQSLSISPSAQGTGVGLSIPVDEAAREAKSAYKARKEPVRRDSQKRREALLKGKEGSRRRQRWENDRFLHVPNAQPPLPKDWEVHPTYPVHTVPYYLAPLWDAGVRHRAEEIAAQKKIESAKRVGMTEEKGRVPQELRNKLKKRKGLKTLLQDLEEEIRSFVRDFERKEREREGKEVEEAELDSEDEEIVFVGRDKNGYGITMSDEQKDVVEEELEREKKVYESLVGSPQAPFARCVTVGTKREAYVGIKEVKTGRRLSDVKDELPRPLWGMI